MGKANTSPTKKAVKTLPHPGGKLPTEQEAEAILSRDGYQSFRWNDVSGSAYPRHRHDYDECIWVLKGEIQFTIDGEEFLLCAGDRLFLPGKTYHTALVTGKDTATYLVGQKR
jgi:quercetin dioxygenase-like cupin family protein